MGVEGFARNKVKKLADVVLGIEVKVKFRRNTKDVFKITTFASERERIQLGSKCRSCDVL